LLKHATPEEIHPGMGGNDSSICDLGRKTNAYQGKWRSIVLHYDKDNNQLGASG
jgi:hypothetical protein